MDKLAIFILVLFMLCSTLAIDKTILRNDNTAYVSTTDLRVDIDKFEAKKNERVTLNLDGIKQVKDICFQFPVDTKDIELNNVKMYVWLLPDIDLKRYEERTKYEVCYRNVNALNDEIYFEPIYHGEGEIKYNITFDNVVLDPYIIGYWLSNNATMTYITLNTTLRDEVPTPFINLTLNTTICDTPSLVGAGPYIELSNISNIYSRIYNTTSQIYCTGGTCYRRVQFRYLDGSAANVSSDAAGGTYTVVHANPSSQKIVTGLNYYLYGGTDPPNNHFCNWNITNPFRQENFTYNYPLGNLNYTLDYPGSANSSLYFNGSEKVEIGPYNDWNVYADGVATGGAPVSTSLWYKNVSGVWHHVVNNSGIWYADNNVSTKPTDFPLYKHDFNYTLGMINSTDYYVGAVDEVMVFNYNLSISDITTLYGGFTIGIDNCSLYGGHNIMQMNMYDEGTKNALSSSSGEIEVYANITIVGIGETYSYSTKFQTTSGSLCVNNIDTTGNYTLNTIIKYSYPDYVTEYYYIENYTSDVNLTIPLYDLNESDSTSFLITYQDENYIYVEGAVIDLQRRYISDNNQFYSVEHGKTDQNGQTRLHLVTEDVIYKFNVWKNNQLLYASPEFIALCQATPCQINIVKPTGDTEEQRKLSNIVFSITDDATFKSSQQVVFNFATVDGSPATILMNVTQSTQYANFSVCNTTSTTSSGSVTCTVPPQYENSSFLVRIYKDGDLLGVRPYTLQPGAVENFGDIGIFMTVLAYVTLSLMAISSPIISIVLGIVGIIMMILVNVFQGGSLFGIGATMVWLFVASGLLIWKFGKMGAG